MTISLIIDPNGSMIKQDLEGYEPLSDAVGGWIESIPASPEITVWCDEEGKLKGLPFNQVATDLWEIFDIFGCVPAGDRLVGPIVIQGPIDEEGECTDCPDWLFERLGLEHTFLLQPMTVCLDCHGTGSLMSHGVHDGAECPECDGWGHTYE